jgi:hypothetical protein
MTGRIEGDDERLRWLLDRAEITELVYRYARVVDEKKWQGWEDCFEPDGVFEMEGTVVRREEMAGWLETHLRFYDATQHIMTNLSIEIDGDRARTVHYLHSSHMPDLERPLLHSDVGGRYDTELVRSADGWRFTRVHLDFLWQAGEEYLYGATGEAHPR